MLCGQCIAAIAGLVLQCSESTYITLIDHHRLTYEEAVQLYQKCKNHVETEDMMVEAFKKFDEQGNGFIMVAELK